MSEGDTSSFEKLYFDLVDEIYAYYRIRIQDEHFIKDLIQKVFLAVWEGAGHFSGSSTVITWILRIARNKWMDTLRHKYRHLEELMDIQEEEIGLENDFVDQLVNHVTLENLLDSLPPTSKELAHLVFIQELSYQEVAQILSIPEGTVKSRMYHLRKQLKKQLRKEVKH
nr:RNA polymerase sigma factor [Thermoflavimicrobium daqui]